MARLNPCPSFINTTQNSLPFRQQPISRTNLILLGQALFKAPAGNVRYWTSVLGNEHPRPSPFDEALDNTALLALKSGAEIARCLPAMEARR